MTEEATESSNLLSADSSEVFESTTCCRGGCYDIVDTFAGKVPQDDVVSLGVKQLSFTFCVTISLWLLTFIAIMINVGLNQPVFSEDLLMFGPMWLGTLIGLIGTALVSQRVCMNATLVSPDHREYMREQGLEQDAKFVDYDSLPLMRRLLCWNIGLFVSFLLVLISQILFSLWFIYGVIGLWHALIPVLILTAGYLVYLYLMNVVSVICCAVVTVAVAQMVLLTVKCNGQLLSWSWSAVCLPLGVVLPSSMSYTAYILAQHIRGRYVLSAAQLWSTVGYVLCLICLYAAFGLTILHEYVAGVPLFPGMVSKGDTSSPDHRAIVGNIQYLLCTVAVALFALSVMVTIRSEGMLVANTRGYKEPTPLSHSKEGWIHTPGAGEIYTILLGTISTKLACGSSQTNTASANTNTSTNGVAVMGTPSRNLHNNHNSYSNTNNSSNNNVGSPAAYGSTGVYSSPGLRGMEVKGGEGIELLPRSASTSPV